MVFCTTIAKIQGVLQKVFITWFSIIVDYVFSHRKLFFLPCVLPFVLIVYEEHPLVLEIRMERILFDFSLKVPQSKFLLPWTLFPTYVDIFTVDVSS